MNRIRASLALALALAASLLIAACGGGGNDEDPQEVLNATFNNDQTVQSGVFDISVDVNAEGGDNAGTFEATLGGPFQGQEGQFPAFDVEAEINLEGSDQDFSGSGGLVSTGEAAFINFQGTDYEVPKQLFDQFATQFTQLQQQSEQEQGGNLLKSLGIDPTNWLSDLENEGTEDVEGTETIHIAGTADTPALIEDIKQIAENAPQAAGEVTPDELNQLDQLTEIVESADFDIFTGEDDDILRKLEADIALDPPDSEGAPESVDLDFSVTLSAINEPQTVEPPSSSQPLGSLLQQFGLDEGALNQLGG
ncbi:MAG: hypothetical protein ACRDL6_04775, partial [Solirubrobacterales bacterium]